MKSSSTPPLCNLTSSDIITQSPISSSLLIRTLNVWKAMVPLLHKNPSGKGPKVIPIRPQLRSTKIMERILRGNPSNDRILTRAARKHPEIRESDGIFNGGVKISTHCPSYCRLFSLFAAPSLPSMEFEGDDTEGWGDDTLFPLPIPPSLIVASKTAGIASNHKCNSSIFAIMSTTSLIYELWSAISLGRSMLISTTYLSCRILVAQTGVCDCDVRFARPRGCCRGSGRPPEDAEQGFRRQKYIPETFWVSLTLISTACPSSSIRV